MTFLVSDGLLELAELKSSGKEERSPEDELELGGRWKFEKLWDRMLWDSKAVTSCDRLGLGLVHCRADAV